ncbi:hypothetical protein Tco_0516567 [Tanacetum coccineum]
MRNPSLSMGIYKFQEEYLSTVLDTVKRHNPLLLIKFYDSIWPVWDRPMAEQLSSFPTGGYDEEPHDHIRHFESINKNQRVPDVKPKPTSYFFSFHFPLLNGPSKTTNLRNEITYFRQIAQNLFSECLGAFQGTAALEDKMTVDFLGMNMFEMKFLMKALGLLTLPIKGWRKDFALMGKRSVFLKRRVIKMDKDTVGGWVGGSSNSRTSNANAVCADCGKCVFNSDHDACVSRYLKDVNARTKKPKASFFIISTSDHNSSELAIQDHSNEQSSSKLVPKLFL